MLLWLLTLLPQPPVPVEAYWLPCLETCENRLLLAREHLKWVEFQIWADKGTPAEDIWTPYKRDAQWRVEVWHTAMMYRLCESMSEPVAEHRKDLLELLGDEAFWAGSLPNPMPVWRWLPR